MLSVGPEALLQHRPIGRHGLSPAVRNVVLELADVLGPVGPSEGPDAAADAAVEGALGKVRVTNPLTFVLLPPEDVVLRVEERPLADVGVVPELADVLSTVGPIVRSRSFGHVVFELP